MDSKNLLKYMGWRCTKLAINTIEHEFYPYELLCFYDLKEYNSKIYIYKKIRCLIENGYIIDLRLN